MYNPDEYWPNGQIIAARQPKVAEWLVFTTQSSLNRVCLSVCSHKWNSIYIEMASIFICAENFSIYIEIPFMFICAENFSIYIEIPFIFICAENFSIYIMSRFQQLNCGYKDGLLGGGGDRAALYFPR